MSNGDLLDLEVHKSALAASVVWSDLEERESRTGLTVQLSCTIDNLPGVLMAEQCDMNAPASYALARLRMLYTARQSIASVSELDDVRTSLGLFVREVFEIGPQDQHTVLVAASRVGDGKGLVAQFVLLGVERSAKELEELSLLSIVKTIEIFE